MIFGMNKQLFKQLCMNYNKEADKDLYELWNYNLRCYDEEEIQRTINIIISNDKYFPTLSRMLEVIKQIIEKKFFTKDKIKYKNTKWFNKEIINEKIDEQSKKDFEDFKRFLEEFRQ